MGSSELDRGKGRENGKKAVIGLDFVKKNGIKVYDDIAPLYPYRQINPLPPIGAFFCLWEKISYVRPKKAEKGEHYEPCKMYQTAYGHPCLLQVVGYTRGIDADFRDGKSNFILCKRISKNGTTPASINASWIVCGAYKAVLISEEEIDEFLQKNP